MVFENVSIFFLNQISQKNSFYFWNYVHVIYILG